MTDSEPQSAWEPVIGLEVHVQLATKSKAFSPSAVRFGAAPNSLTDPIVLALPGTLPQFNRHAFELALRLGVATGSKIQSPTRFARKHYFYPDLPKGYQISQYNEPLCEHGHLEIIVNNAVKNIPLQRIHLEEDAGKNIHIGALSHVDLNRAGVPLVEVVSAPEMHSSEEAAEFMRSLHRLVRWLGISEADMEKGQLRCDANVSVRRRGDQRLGTRTELKNINSFRFVQNAIDHEIVRQCQLLERGERVVQETRLWNAERGSSEPMRSKETAEDYRYFPDPDLPPLPVSADLMDDILRNLPELPAARFVRYVERHNLSPDDARTLINDKALSDYFEAAESMHPGDNSGKTIANWVLSELLRELNAEGKSIEDAAMPPERLSELVSLIEDGTISGKIGKEIFKEAYKTGESPIEIVERRGLQQISDEEQLAAIVASIVTANPKQAQAYAAGKDGLFGFFVGRVMQATNGRANPVITSNLLQKRLRGGDGT